MMAEVPQVRSRQQTTSGHGLIGGNELMGNFLHTPKQTVYTEKFN
jgi:hypothetical protein